MWSCISGGGTRRSGRIGSPAELLVAARAARSRPCVAESSNGCLTALVGSSGSASICWLSLAVE